VDASYFSPTDGAYDADTISFIGRMDYYPNQECMSRFCKQVWPLLKQRRPALKLLIVGADPSPEMRALGGLPGVTVTGSVPDVRPFIRGSALMVAPLAIARGTQNKILEAMGMGVPVVTSSAAAGGVDAEAEQHFLVADSPADLAAAVLRIVENPNERARLATAGRERMLSHHAWPRSMQRLDGIIGRCREAFAAKNPKTIGSIA
jgi:glycosyltransferase involved in cell wall biosynthesis